MKKILMTVAIVAGLFVAVPSAFAGQGHHNGHHGVHHYNGHHGVHHNGHHYNGHHNGHHYNGHHNRSGFSFGIYVGPNYRNYPRPYPYPYPRPYPTPRYPSAVNVLVTEYCFGRVHTHYVTAYWNYTYGGYWYYDCMGVYRRAR